MNTRDRSATVTELGRWPLDGREGRGRQVRLLTVEHPPGVHTPPYRHPGWVVAYVLAGPVVSQLEGESLRTYHAGDWWVGLPGRLHVDAGNDNPDTTSKILAFSVIKPDDPVLVPEPEDQA